MSKRSARYLLQDMLDAINAINTFTAGYFADHNHSFAAFRNQSYRHTEN